MASPFNVFRKHQRVMLVVTGLLAMISFVFLGPLMDTIGGGGGGYTNPVVVRTVYGKLRASDVERMVVMQNILVEFLNRAAQESNAKHGRNKSDWRGRAANATQQSVVADMLLAKKAEKLGVVVSDEVILQKLEQFGLTEDEMTSLLAGSQINGRPVRIDDIFEAYRQLLLADEVQRIYGLPTADDPYSYLYGSQAPSSPTPVEYWERFRRLNELVRIETVALPVDKFLDKVPDPSVAELEKFFEEHKDKVNLPNMIGNVRMNSPTPGFKIPRKIQFRYLEASYLMFEELASAAVTDAEIAKYYADHKSDFEKVELLDDPAAEPKEGAPPEPPDDPEEPAKAEPAKDESAKDEPAKEEPTNEEPAKEAAADDNPIPAKSAEELAKEAELKKAADSAAAKSGEPEKKEPTYQTLEEATPEIRRKLGQQRAAGLMIDTLKPVADKLSAYWRPTVRDKLTKGDKETSEFPDGMDELIQKSHLVLKETTLVSPTQLMDLPLGQARIDQSGQPFFSVGFNPGLKPFQLVSTIDNDGDFVDDGNRYLIWKVKEVEDRVPALDEVRQQAIRAWKRPKALELAKAEAKRLADKARTRPGVPLEKALADEKDIDVVVSEPFSWLTQGSIAQTEFNAPVRLSEIDGVEGAGPDFMKAVFGLKDDAVEVLTNYPQDAAFVVRIAERVTSQDALRNLFLQLERFGDLRRKPWVLEAKTEDMQQVYAALQRELELESELQWEVNPDEEPGQP